MKNHLSLFVSIACLSAVLTVPSGCAPKVAAQAEASPAPSAPATPGQVVLDSESLSLARFTVEAVQEAELAESLTFNGSVEANPSSLAIINSRVKAKVIAMNAELGQQVRAGEVVAIVESEDLHGAQVAYRLAVKKEALAKDNLARRTKLAGLGEFERHHLEDYQQSLSQLSAQFSDTEGEVKTTRAALEEAKSEEKSLAAALEQAQTRLGSAQARAARSEALFKEELIARQDLEQAQAERKQAQSEVVAAEARAEQGAARSRSAAAKWEAAQAHRNSVDEQRQRAASALTREEKVVKGGYTRDKELVEAQNALQQAQIEVESALDDIELLGGQPGDMHSIPIHAPLSGRITERHASLGETVDMTKPLYTVFNGTEVWVQLSVPPAQLSRLRPGALLTVSSDAAPGKSLPATVVTLGESADTATRMVKVRCRVKGGASALRPGMFVTGNWTVPSAIRGIALPEDAVQEVDGRSVVFVATEKPEVFATRTVTVAARRDGKALVREGIKSGERVVVRNAALLKDKLK
jgi:RND family efflux transporter MFP subunit